MRFLIVLVLFCLFSCSGDSSATSLAKEETAEQRLQESLLGTWEITEMRVKSPTYQGIADSTFIQHIKEADWLQVYGVKPARTTYTEDGKLKRILYFRDGSVTDVINGLWKVKGDSLLVIEPNITFDYETEVSGEKLKLKGLIDYDRDGEADDTYEANYRLVARTR